MFFLNISSVCTQRIWSKAQSAECKPDKSKLLSYPFVARFNICSHPARVKIRSPSLQHSTITIYYYSKTGKPRNLTWHTMEKLFQLLFLWDTTIPNQKQQYCLFFNLGHHVHHNTAWICKLLLIFIHLLNFVKLRRSQPAPAWSSSVRYWCWVGGSRSCLYFLVSNHGTIDSCAPEQRKQ